MELVLDVYKRACDPQFTVVCMDESPKQQIEDGSPSTKIYPGQAARTDYE
jgi:hypothetical protein